MQIADNIFLYIFSKRVTAIRGSRQFCHYRQSLVPLVQIATLATLVVIIGAISSNSDTCNIGGNHWSHGFLLRSGITPIISV